MELVVIGMRFAVTFILSFLFGIERQYSHKPIGFGTYTFVSIGSCSLAIIAVALGFEHSIPLLSAIVTGIGFLGAGALIKTNDKIFGLTSAASIWAFAIFGLTIGIGEYVVGILLYLMIWLVVISDRTLERYGIGSYQKKVTIQTQKIVNIKDVIAAAGIRKYKLIDIDIDKAHKKMTFHLYVEGKKEDINTIPDKIINQEWFEDVKIE
ncbi:MAG: MgtC/SapB family protein [Nanoarchaeota archaeon]|nr:MgtC/SapB family protein [Nanoarchaeota archaeon]